MAISLIAALDENYAIGHGNKLPWHLPDDLRRFKELTLGKRVLMGHNTALSIGRALPDRMNMVLTRRHDAPYPGQLTVRSLDEALGGDEDTDLMVIGGAMVFAEALPRARHMYLTWVATVIESADRFFPSVPFREWAEMSRVHHAADARHAYAFDSVQYLRKT
ncbi:MAG: dihydrofolate reductase [Xanthomonadales bacterium]|nr:dihydrofolate reductase [Xanthomonadales bacterium]